jgi:hypothetical protein
MISMLASTSGDLDNMRASVNGRQELAARVQQALALATKKEAETVVDTVVTALEATLEQPAYGWVHAEARAVSANSTCDTSRGFSGGFHSRARPS